MDKMGRDTHKHSERERMSERMRIKCMFELCARAVVITDSTIVIWIEERCENRQKGKLFCH